MMLTTTRTLTAVALAVLVMLTASPKANSGLPVFPGAEGFGSTTVAGRGGRVLRVTNLNDSGTGSLRAAVEASGRRVVIFDVSGTIQLKAPLRIRNPYLTIAGQTAPAPGITLRNAALQVVTNDVLIQHLRVRVGDSGIVRNQDALWLMNGSNNVVVDHNSFSWAIDENVGISGRNVTLSNNIISEGLSQSVNTRGEHSKGSLVSDGAHQVSLLRNLFAHNVERNPQFSGDVRVMVVNNVNYNPGSLKGGMYFSNGYHSSWPTIASIVGNVLLPGRDTPSDIQMIWLRESASSGSALYVADNHGPGVSSNPWSAVKNSAGSRVVASEAPVWTPVTVLRSSDVLGSVLNNAGARPKGRDAVDDRIVSEVRLELGNIIHTQAQVGGWPTLPANRRVLSLPADPNGDRDRDGYTNLEEWLHDLAAGLERNPSGQMLSAPTGLRILR